MAFPSAGWDAGRVFNLLCLEEEVLSMCISLFLVSSQLWPQILGWHFYARENEKPSWLQNQKESKCGQDCTALFAGEAPLLQFKLPHSIEHIFLWVEDFSQSASLTLVTSLCGSLWLSGSASL